MTFLMLHGKHPLRGELPLLGDKSISHRGLILGAISIGKTHIRNLLNSEDIVRTSKALKQMGVSICHEGDLCTIQGVGQGGLCESKDILNMGNSGTSARLLIGLLSTYGFKSFLSGDSSLINRPMDRVMEPLSQMGALFFARKEKFFPLMLQGNAQSLALRYTLPVPSAQVKSAILLAALNSFGTTTILEPRPTRDHTEKMLPLFGGKIFLKPLPEGQEITVPGRQVLRGCCLDVPGDPSSAGILAVAALIIPHSHILLKNVLKNPRRTKLFDILIKMGGKITWINERPLGNETVADLTIEHSDLWGIEIPAHESADLIDEYPILSVAAIAAQGKSVFHGLEELQFKESNRFLGIAEMLSKAGGSVTAQNHCLIIEGKGLDALHGGGVFDPVQDHRQAMSALILGIYSQNPIHVKNSECIQTSFPTFLDIFIKQGYQPQRAHDYCH